MGLSKATLTCAKFKVVTTTKIYLKSKIKLSVFFHIFDFHYNIIVFCSHEDLNLVPSLCLVQPLTTEPCFIGNKNKLIK